jgi:hypothetical protein
MTSLQSRFCIDDVSLGLHPLPIRCTNSINSDPYPDFEVRAVPRIAPSEQSNMLNARCNFR